MPITISLQKLVRLDESRPLWPKQLQSFAAELEKNPKGKSTWMVLADWFEESHTNEPQLAKVCRVIGRNASVTCQKSEYGYWSIRGLPSLCGHSVSTEKYLIGCAAQAADNIDEALAELEVIPEPEKDEPVVNELPEPGNNTEEVATLPATGTTEDF